jgi:hypothetical protein
MMGEPIVRREVYIKYCLIREVAMPIRLPMAVQTPKAFHSTKSLNFLPLIVANYKNLWFLKGCSALNEKDAPIIVILHQI